MTHALSTAGVSEKHVNSALIAGVCMAAATAVAFGATAFHGLAQKAEVHLTFQGPNDLVKVLGYRGGIRVAMKNPNVPVIYRLKTAAGSFDFPIKPAAALEKRIDRSAVRIPVHRGDRLDCNFGCTLTLAAKSNRSR